MVVVKFKKAVFSERYDACAPGDLLRCDEAYARHVVEDLKAAEYVQPAAVLQASPAGRRGTRTLTLKQRG